MNTRLSFSSPPTTSVWEREYASLHSIPGSLRETPAKVLLELWRCLPKRFDADPVLDAGCGAGRNAIYVASQGYRVEAVDASESALEIFRSRLRECRASERITIRRLSLDERLPFPDGTFSIVLDIYVSCHFLEDARRDAYWDELRRLLRPGGYALTAFFSTEDEYYRRLIHQEDGGSPTVVDPVNSIAKRLYQPEELRLALESKLTVVDLVPVTFDDIVLGTSYRRSILGCLLRR